MPVDQIFHAIATWIFAVITVGGTSAAIAYGLFRWLGAQWLDQHFKKRLEELKHAQQRELELLKHEINSLFSRVSKIHEKEFEVLPEAWCLLLKAQGTISEVVSALKLFPDFQKMSEQQFEEFVAQCRLADFQQIGLRTAENRLKYYQEQIRWIELNDAKSARTALNNYLTVNSIFMTSGLQEMFNKINRALGDIIIDQEHSYQGYQIERPRHGQTLNEVSAILSQIEAAVQKRLRYEEA